MGAVVECSSLVKIYRVDGRDVLALQGLDLVVEAGEMVGIVGASGSGKSTLLSVIGGVVEPTAGTVEVAGVDLVSCTHRERAKYRRNRVGFVWQHSSQNLIAELSALDNVVRAIAAVGRKGAGIAARDSARSLLDKVGLADRADHKPQLLSGGEQARVALAVALATDPVLLLADEPTGELDRATTDEVFGLMRELNTSLGLTQVIVSHDAELVEHVDRVIGIRDGRRSTEQRGATDGSGASADQRLVVDDVGRVQLPAAALERLDLADGVTADVQGDKIVLRPASAGRPGADTPTGPARTSPQAAGTGSTDFEFDEGASPWSREGSS